MEKKKDNSMKYFSIGWHVDATGHMLVEAVSEDAAKAYAVDNFFPDEENTELGDAQEIVSCTELTKEEYEKYKSRQRT